MLLTFFLLNRSLSQSICLSDSDTAKCPKDCDYYYGNENISQFSFDQISDNFTKIFVFGKIYTEFTPSFNENEYNVDIIGEDKSLSHIEIIITNFSNSNISFTNIDVKFNTNISLGIKMLKIENSTINSPENTVLICKDVIIETFQSFIYMCKMITSIKSQTISIDFLKHNIEENLNVALECDTLNLNGISNLQCGFRNNEILISNPEIINMIMIRIKQKSTIIFNIDQNNQKTSFINYYQYYQPYYSHIIITVLSGEVEFKNCEWFSNDLAMVIYVNLAATLFIETSLPASIVTKDRVIINTTKPYIKINSIVANSFVSFYSSKDSLAVIDVDEFRVEENGKIIDLNDKTELLIENLQINTANQFFLSCISGSKYTVKHIFANSVNSFGFDIDTLSVSDYLWIELPDTGIISNLRASNIEGNGYIYIRYPESSNYIVGNDIFLIQFEEASKTIDFELIAPTTHYNKGSVYLQPTRNYDNNLRWNKIKLTAAVVESEKSDSFCLGDGCEDTDINLSSNKEENTNWIDHFINSRNHIQFRILNNNYTDRNFINLFRLCKFPQLNLEIIGNKNDPKSFVFDGLMIHQFSSIDFSSINGSIHLPRSHINMNKATIRNSYIDKDLIKILISVPHIKIDYQSLQNIKTETGNIRLELTKEDQQITLISENCSSTIYLYEDCLCFNDINISCKNINLDPGVYSNLTIEGKTEKSLKYYVRIRKSFNYASFYGVFPSDLVVPTNITHTSHLEIHSNFCPLSFIMNNNSFLDILLSTKTVLIPFVRIVGGSSMNIDTAYSEKAILTVKHLEMIYTSYVKKSSQTFDLVFEKISFRGAVVSGSQYGNFSILKLDQDWGANLAFNTDKSMPKIIEVPFSISRMPYMSFRNGTYNNLKINFIPLSTDKSYFEADLVKSNRQFYLDPIRIACGPTINCSSWDINFNPDNHFWKLHFHLKCQSFKSRNESCLTAQFDAPNNNSLIVVYSLICFVFFISGCAFIITRKYLKYKSTQSDTTTYVI